MQIQNLKIRFKESFPDGRLDINADATSIVLNTLIVPKEHRKSGIGTRVMEELCQIADSSNRVLFVTPSTHYGATSVERLRKFYRRFGFVRNFGKTKRYDFPLHGMYRLPNKR